LDNVIIALPYIPLQPSPFQYFLNCWKRAVKIQRMPRLEALIDGELLNEIQRQCVSYAGLSVSIPDMFE